MLKGQKLFFFFQVGKSLDDDQSFATAQQDKNTQKINGKNLIEAKESQRKILVVFLHAIKQFYKVI